MVVLAEGHAEHRERACQGGEALQEDEKIREGAESKGSDRTLEYLSLKKLFFGNGTRGVLGEGGGLRGALLRF